MELSEVIRHINTAGTVYLCDVARWLGKDAFHNLSFKEKFELVDKITEIKTLSEYKKNETQGKLYFAHDP